MTAPSASPTTSGLLPDSRKAVVTCRDSGGPAELVQDGVSGFVCEPAPSALALALREMGEDPGV